MNKIVVHSYAAVINIGPRCVSAAELEVVDKIRPIFVRNFELGRTGVRHCVAASAKRS
jgi:hypothetical protein